MTDPAPAVAPDPRPTVVAGTDTHADTHHAAVLDANTGTILGDANFTTGSTGYETLLGWLLEFGVLLRAGVVHLANRHHRLSIEIDALKTEMIALVNAAAPTLIAAKGIGTITAA